MQCRNVFCVYYKDDACVLENVSLDEQGSCEEMIYIDIDDNILKEKRERVLEKFAGY